MSNAITISPNLLKEIYHHVEAGHISVKTCDLHDLRIFNYTPRCQYDWIWTPATITCRGLSLDPNDNIIARPFPKFFTIEQYGCLNNFQQLYGISYDNILDGDFTVTEKYDGSLIIITNYNNNLVISSRGSFTSPQAIKAHNLASHFDINWFLPGYTYLFEIIYPENRDTTPLVVDYGNQEELILLAVIDNATGLDVCVKEWSHTPVAKTYDAENILELFLHDIPGREGYVIHLQPSNIRIKIKFDNYTQLQRLVNNTTRKHIWKLLSDHEKVEIDLLPIFLQNKVQDIIVELKQEFESVKRKAMLMTQTASSKKVLALNYNGPNKELLPVAFAIMDNKPKIVEKLIWKYIKPKRLNVQQENSNEE